MTFSRAGSRRAASLTSGALLGLCAVLVAPPARAQSDDAATAEALFEDAKKAMDAGDYVTACPKFAESQRLDPGVGTLTGLALCHEKQGKTASAWAEYIEVVTEATRANQLERAKFAKQHASDLEPKLSKLTLTVDPATAKLPGLTIKRDDVAVRQASWGTPLPVDPGTHTIAASATGKQKWTTQIDVGTEGDLKSVTVPALEDAPSDTATETESSSKTSEESTPETPPAAGGGGGRTVGIVVGVAGLAGLVTGSIFGIEALSKSSQAKTDCPSGLCPDGATYNTATSINSDAKTAALISDIGLGIGVAGVAVGAILVFASGSGPSPAAAPAPPAQNPFRVTPFVTRDGGGAAVFASW